jgi:GNAT superfamily N-acetyltransferase
MATRPDTPALLTLVNEWYEEDGEKPIKKLSDRFVRACFGKARADIIIVAEDADGLIGYAYIQTMYDFGDDDPYLNLENLFVAKTKRKLGVGSKLMGAASRKAKQLNASCITWLANTQSRKTMQFYAKLGAERSEYTPMFLMGRSLSANARRIKSI